MRVRACVDQDRRPAYLTRPDAARWTRCRLLARMRLIRPMRRASVLEMNRTYREAATSTRTTDAKNAARVKKNCSHRRGNSSRRDGDPKLPTSLRRRTHNNLLAVARCIQATHFRKIDDLRFPPLG